MRGWMNELSAQLTAFRWVSSKLDGIEQKVAAESKPEEVLQIGDKDK